MARRLPPQPVHCRPPAYELFAAQLPTLETPRSLLVAAVAVSMHQLEDVDPQDVESELQRLANLVRARVKGDSPRALLAHAHEVLFEDQGFQGNVEDYYNPLNSYVPSVLTTRRGLPITLTLIYKNVLERLGLRVHGINAPDHFLAGVEIERGSRPILIDAFFGGRELSREEAVERIEQVRGVKIANREEMLLVATHRQWIGRMLVNLQNIFARTDRAHDIEAMLELRALLEKPQGASAPEAAP